MKPSERVKAPVTTRTVKRYFFNGKGYATKRAAYVAKARRMLMEMVFGPWEEHCSPDGEFSYEVLSGFDGCPSDSFEKRQWMNERFALFFPHDNCETAVQPGCLHMPRTSRYWESPCQSTSSGYGDDAEFDFAFKSCIWSQRQWIDAKVRELMEAHDA